MNYWNIIFLITGIVIVLPYLAVPLVVRARQVINRSPDYNEIGQGGLPADVLQFFNSVSGELLSLGFTYKTTINIRNFAPGQNTFFQVYYHLEDKNAAVITDMLQEIPGTKGQHTRYTEFNTVFENGLELGVTNNKLVRPPGFCTDKIIIHIPDYAGLDKLYRLHKELKLFYGKGSPCRLPDEGQIISEIKRTLLKELECSVKSGFQYLDKSTNQYRPTLKGAYMTTWHQLWPVGSIKLALLKRKARKLIQLA